MTMLGLYDLAFVGPGEANCPGWDGTFSIGSAINGTCMHIAYTPIIRIARISVNGFTGGIHFDTGANQFSVDACDIFSNRNFGILFAGNGNGSLGPGCMVHNSNDQQAAGSSEYVSNIWFGGGCSKIRIGGGLIDEPYTGNVTPTNVSNIRFDDCADCELVGGQVFVPAGKGGGAESGYGIYVGANSVRTTLRGRVTAYARDTNYRVPTNTIYIAAGAVDTVLDGVTTNPNTGGDISDNGTNTVFTRVNGFGGPQTAPAIPASGATFANPFPYDCSVYITGGTVTAIDIGGCQVPTGVTLTTSSGGGSLAGGATYAYRVSALNNEGQTLASSEVTIAVPTGTSTNTVTISWDQVPGAKTYDIYGRTSGGELFMVNVTGQSWTDTGAIPPSGALPSSDTSLSSTGLTAGLVRVPAGSTIALTYTLAPSWTWVGD